MEKEDNIDNQNKQQCNVNIDINENKNENENAIITVESILTNLKIISNLKPNDKLTIKDNILVIDQPYYYQGVTRWWNQDSRTGTMAELEKIVNDTFTIIDNIYTSELQSKTGSSIDNNFYYKRSIPESYFKNENSQQLQSFSSELSNAIKGLQNLKLTYKNDISICSKIDVMIEKITIRIKKINSLLTIRPKDSSLTK